MPKKTVKKIVDSGNHYLIQVKKNQAVLQENIVATSQTAQPLSQHKVEETNRGSQKTWVIEVFQAVTEQLKAKWAGLQTYVVVSKTELKKGVSKHYTRYFMSDLTTLTAEEFAKGIRQHWGIENKLHRTRDVSFRQDKNKIRNIQAATNRAVFNTIAINELSKIDKSIEEAKLKVSVNFKELLMKNGT